VLAAFGTFSLIRIVRERDRAESAEAQARARLDDSEELARFMLRDQHDRLQKVGRLDLLEPVAREAIAHYVRSHAHGDPPSVGEADAHERLAQVLQQKGDLAGARAEFERELAIMSALAVGAPWDVKRARDLAITHNDLGNVRDAVGDADGAIAEYRVALEG